MWALLAIAEAGDWPGELRSSFGIPNASFLRILVCRAERQSQ